MYLARDVWLGALGSALVHDEGAGKAEIAVVLAGDSWGYRLTKAAELVRQGCVPLVLVSGSSRCITRRCPPARKLPPSWTTSDSAIFTALCWSPAITTAPAPGASSEMWSVNRAAGRFCAWWPRATGFSVPLTGGTIARAE